VWKKVYYFRLQGQVVEEEADTIYPELFANQHCTFQEDINFISA
jgi:hypothetical protein